MQILLTSKFADAIDGIDLSRHCVGDLIDLPQHDADILVAEGWASVADNAAVQSERAGVVRNELPADGLTRVQQKRLT